MTYVLSDIHGNRKAFDSILEQIDLQPDDGLYILGDVIDRHPHGIALLQQIMAMPNAYMLLGNHEYMMLRALGFPYDGPEDIAGEKPADLRKLWYQNGGKVTHKAWKRLPEEMQVEIVDYLISLPLNYELEVGGELFKLVHAAPEELYELVGDPEETRTFFSVWDREAVLCLDALEAVTVVFGHTPTAYFQKARPLEVFRRGKLVGIDCGAGWPESCGGNPTGGRLACIRLEDMEVFYSRSENTKSYEPPSELYILNQKS